MLRAYARDRLGLQDPVQNMLLRQDLETPYREIKRHCSYNSQVEEVPYTRLPSSPGNRRLVWTRRVRGARQLPANRISVSLPAVVDVRYNDGSRLIEAEEDAPFADT